jgi:PAS domain S-box-containing protein
MDADDALPRIRVLYAEDDPFDADLTRAHFEAAAPEFEIDLVRTGRDCLARLAEQRYDVLLLDNHLPDMDGIHVLRTIAVEHPRLPVVVTTSVGDEDLAVRVLQLGARDYVPKDGRYLERLPWVLATAMAEHHAVVQRQSERRWRRILYVEHDAADVDLTVAHLAEVAPHLHIDLTRSGPQALAFLAVTPFDLVLADLRLAGMSALELMHEAKVRGCGVPFIVVTGRGDEAAAVAALKLGAYDYIVKRDDYLTRLPYAIEHAIARCELAEANRRLERELEERRRLQQATAEALALTDTLQKQAPIGFAFLDAESRLHRVNDEFARLTGYPAGVHEGRTLHEIAPDLAQQAEPACRLALHGETALNVEITTRPPDNPTAERHFMIGAYPVRDTEQAVLGAGLVVAEITGRKQAEAALREHAVAMADLAKQKDEFLAMLSHELRNPLAPIRSAVEILGRAGASDETTAQARRVIERQVAHLARLVDDLLDVARIRTGRVDLKIEPLDLRRVISEALEEVSDLIDARHQRLETSLPAVPVTVRGDATRLVQVVTNLLSNAAKYTDDGGRIAIRLSTEEGQAELQVSDTGMGIPARLLPKIFDLFTQDERTLDRAHGGLGLGLTIVRRITELHGGTIGVRSAGRGQGSAFTIRLPLHVMSHPADVTRQPADLLTGYVAHDAPHAPRRCLVVEDNIDAARMVELALTLEGHEVRLALDGLDALELAGAFQPDVVILDIGLPRMNGYDTARAIRTLPGLSDVRIIGVTGYGQPADHERSQEAGFDTHLVKPVELDLLLEHVAAGRATSDRR